METERFWRNNSCTHEQVERQLELLKRVDVVSLRGHPRSVLQHVVWTEQTNTSQWRHLWEFQSVYWYQWAEQVRALFWTPPLPIFLESYWKSDLKKLEYKPERFNFKLSAWDTNFVHIFSLCSHAFLMKKSTASCFEFQKQWIRTHYYSQIVWKMFWLNKQLF